jgi:hypothetical protein
MVPGDGIGPNVCPFDSVGWPRRLEFMAEAPISVTLEGNQHSQKRMVFVGCFSRNAVLMNCAKWSR